MHSADQTERRVQYMQAVAADHDDATENVVKTLTVSDQGWLLALMSDRNAEENADLRWWTVRALAECGTAAALPTLQRALADDVATVRACAALALAHLYARAPAAVRPALVDLAQLLADDDGVVRQTASDALARIGNDAIEALANLLAGESAVGDHEGARSRATAALRKIGTMQAAGILYRYLNDPNYLVRNYAFEALDEMGLLETQLLIL